MMKRKTKTLKTRSSNEKRKTKKLKGTVVRRLLGQLGISSVQHQSSPSKSWSDRSNRFQNFLESVDENAALSVDVDAYVDDKETILTQDFFCTPDYITPDNQNLLNSFDCNKENIPCPKSPEKLNTTKSKRYQQDGCLVNSLSPSSGYQDVVELAKDTFGIDEIMVDKKMLSGTQKTQNYVSQSAVALRCRVMPPPCIKNPYQKDASGTDIDPFGNQRVKCGGFFPAIIGGNGLSRYHTDFHEIEQIGVGHFSRVFKVLKRIDGCFYAVKHITRQLQQDVERRKALMEVQAMAALAWFENDQLYIQMELCDHSLSIGKASQLFTEGEVLKALHQIAKALQFIHKRGLAHLDVKPDNIYVKNGAYKLGDFGCATLLDKSLPFEEGDAHYMPQEILNENYDHLDKVDIFSLGAAIYELIRGSPLQEAGPQFSNLRDGKLPLLPGHSLQFQNLLKVMMEPDPVRRPSAKELVENPIFDRIGKKFTNLN
ncbi:wee1-like protein kinase isoform X2 [Mangifera indica]|uniref:wee1-like protein kinase isoform X2 n=1 Tax=Mangifera indica TaxID=29780 RepID=UPI001CFC3DF6|nr:wee1-like protein kinase isoform X2 [Mangifera indica]